MRTARLLVGLTVVSLSTTCGGSPGGSTSGPPSEYVFDPDVPAWRGGCFYDGSPGKIVNGFPSQDIRMFGTPCGGPDGEPAGPGGLVYLDNFDPFTGRGDVTILSAEAGSEPLVIAPDGGTGGVIPGSTGACIDGEETKLLTLSNVGDVSGELLLVNLPGGASSSIASDVRVENYEFLPDGAILFVGNYAASSGVATSSKGDLFVWEGGAKRTLAEDASRFDYIMYRLDKPKSQIAYLVDYTEQGGELYVRALDGLTPALHVDDSVSEMTFADDDTLVYTKYGAGEATRTLHFLRHGEVAPEESIADDVWGFGVVGETVIYATGWDVLGRTASLWRTTTEDGASPTLLSSKSPLLYQTVPPDGEPSLIAYADEFDPDLGTADLFVVPLAGGPAVPIDTGFTPEGGLFFSPAGRFLAYTKGFDQPVTPSDPSTQPGIADGLWVARTDGTQAPRLVASLAAAERVVWSASEMAVGALGDFDRASNSGHLRLSSSSSGVLWFEAEDVGLSSFDVGVAGFGAPAHLAALGNWNDALQTGDLLLAPAEAAGPNWVVDSGVSFFLPPRGNRIVYAVRGGGRDGLWLGAGQ